MLGEKLQIARKESKLTLEQIAERLGISYQAYRKIEKGLNNPSLENLMKIAELYNLSIDYLLGYTDEKRPLFPGLETHAFIYGTISAGKTETTIEVQTLTDAQHRIEMKKD